LGGHHKEGLRLKEFLGVFLPLVSGVIAWYANERRKRQQEEYIRKEENYKILIRSIKGFYVSSKDSNVIGSFIEQLNLCWLYCPDDVIKKAYEFLHKVHTGANSSDPEKEKTLGELIVAIRKDLLSRKIIKNTNLTADDFMHIRAT
jgi:Pyruvate/2-oxoacid:ferredoxin oxidoreductase delta subunit